MEASNVGKHGSGKKNCCGTSNWLDLDLIYERTLFLFISVSPSLSLSGCSPSLASYLIVHTHEQHKIRNMRAHMQTGKNAHSTACHPFAEG